MKPKSKTLLAASVMGVAFGTVSNAQQRDAICAVEQVIACEAFQPCERGLPGGVNLPALIKIDNANGVIISRTMAEGDRKSPISSTEALEDGYLFTGVDSGNGWSLRLDGETGRFTLASAHNGVAYVGFGVCASEE